MKKTLLILGLIAGTLTSNAQDIPGYRIENGALEIDNNNIEPGNAGFNALTETRGNYNTMRFAISHNLFKNLNTRAWEYRGTTWDNSFNVIGMAGGEFRFMGAQNWSDGEEPGDNRTDGQLMDEYTTFRISRDGHLAFSGTQVEMGKDFDGGPTARVLMKPSNNDMLFINVEGEVGNGIVLNKKVSVTERAWWNASSSLNFGSDMMFNVDGNSYFNGYVKIGDYDAETPDGYKLYVSDGILAEKVKVSVKNTSDWADYVFADDYTLAELSEVEKFIEKEHHLPNIPSAEEMVKTGLDVAKTDALLLQKIEELTLYIIELNKRVGALEKGE